jgi:Pyruvate/2-oxoacid:ferredoxin oxidoreductase delta subunit
LFLEQMTRLLRRAGYRAEPLDPLSPRLNLPRLAVEAGLGNLSPYGLLVHPVFGPRLILSGVRTDYAPDLRPRFQGEACFDCMACLTLCPQQPQLSGVVDLGQCQTCAKCFVVCPVGKGRQARQALSNAASPDGDSIAL